MSMDLFKLTADLDRVLADRLIAPVNHFIQQPFCCLALQRRRSCCHRERVSFGSRLPVILRSCDQPFGLKFPE